MESGSIEVKIDQKAYDREWVKSKH